MNYIKLYFYSYTYEYIASLYLTVSVQYTNQSSKEHSTFHQNSTDRLPVRMMLRILLKEIDNLLIILLKDYIDLKDY